MRQLITGTLIIILFLSAQTVVASSRNYQEWTTIVFNEMDPSSNTFVYSNFSKTVQELVNKRLYEASNFSDQYSSSPYLWYLKGWLTRQQLYLYIVNARRVGVFDLSKDKRAQALQDEYQFFYQKAMELDDNPDVPKHLTAMMLTRIGTDAVGDPAIKVRAMEKAAALARAGKNDGGSEMFEWNTYEVRLGIYIDAKDYDNALKTVNEMLERFPSTRTDELLRWQQNIEAKVAK